jgi:hypothetical protein
MIIKHRSFPLSSKYLYFWKKLLEGVSNALKNLIPLLDTLFDALVQSMRKRRRIGNFIL